MIIIRAAALPSWFRHGWTMGRPTIGIREASTGAGQSNGWMDWHSHLSADQSDAVPMPGSVTLITLYHVHAMPLPLSPGIRTKCHYIRWRQIWWYKLHGKNLSHAWNQADYLKRQETFHNNSKHTLNVEQESWAIAKTTARCAQYMGAPENFW